MAILERFQEMQNAQGENRLIIILDGMGVATMEKLLDKRGFFCSHLSDIEQSIIPATTVAATTAYRTGKMPCETGFIGWCQYFSEVDEVVEVYSNKNFYTREDSKLPHHSNTLPCKTVVEKLNASCKRAFDIVPWFMGGYKTFDEWLNRIVEVCNQETDAYIYAYWPEPDSTLHRLGSNDITVKTLLREMEQKIEKALEKIHNKTDILITADHGHKDVTSLFLEDYPDIEKCLLHPISLESRCVSFFVKPQFIKQFPDLFNKHFGKYFKLVEKTKFEKEYLHAKEPVRFVGDFIALATDKYDLWQNRNIETCKSHHAGITPDETQIPIIKVRK